MCSYLNVYAFRHSVPEHLRGYFLTATGKPRTEWRYSLGTRIREEAKSKCHIKAVETDRLIAEAQALFDAGTPPKHSANSLDRQRADRRFELELEAIMASAEENAAAEREWDDLEDEGQEFVNSLKGPVSELSRSQRVMRRLIPESEFDADDVKAARNLTNQADERQGAIEGLRLLKDLWAGKPSHLTLAEMFESYIAETKPAAATVKRWRGIISEFVEFVGHDDATKIDVSDLPRWKAALAGNRTNGRPSLNARTIRDVYFAAVKSTFSWGVDNGQVDINPVTHAKVRVRRGAITRGKDFTEQDAQMT